ncbi:MAG: hypothetical protein BHW38_03560 [Firmicutes bacterium CAG:321_26_22]|nr:MAG: hypothetical protein BHW38_03560 [Firmicutes bacterium CAG:321_26_22]
MFNLEDDDTLTIELLNKIIETDEQYKDNEYLKYLINNEIISGISYGNFKKICEFIGKEDIYNVYDYNFLNLICKNMVLLYSDVDEEDIDDPEEVQHIDKIKKSVDSFYEIIDSGNLNAFDKLINLLLENNKNKKDKIKLMLDVASNFKKYSQLVDEIIKKGQLDFREKYAVLGLLKFDTEYYDDQYYKSDYEEYERDFYPDDEVINNITTLEDLKKYTDACYVVQISRIKELNEDDYYGDANYMIKNEITKALANIKYFGNESLDTIGFETSSLKELRNSVTDESIKEELSKYILFMSLIDSILKIDDLRKLKVIASRILNFKKSNDTIYTIYNYTENMAKRIKEIYAHEIKEKLIDFTNLENGNNQLYSRTNSKFTADSKMLYDEDITGRKVDYIELSGIDYVSLVHVLNAYGEGGTLKDFKTPRIIGKEYICLSAIDETKEKIAKSKQDDEEHVCLLFSNIAPDQLISESFEDLYSDGDLNSLSITFGERENFRPIKKQIQLNEGSHTEFVLYRDSSNGNSIYPSGILIQNEMPTQAEINAAAYLNVPLVFINHEKYKNKSNSLESKSDNTEPYKPTSEDYRLFRESLMELRDSINGKGKGR